ncbi:MAG: hypothetical protein ACOYB1_18985 [Limnohabitans sp.]|jgi:hypothetical protein
MNWLSRFMLANWSHIFDALLLSMALLCGIQIGQSRVQKAWDAEKQKIAQAQAKQEQHVADVRQSQSQITQEISREFAKKSKLLADRQPDSRAGGVCNLPAAGGGDLSAVSEGSERAAPACTNSLSAPQGDALSETCSQLYQDAQRTTLMLLEIQKWFERQAAVHDRSNP